MIVIITSCLFRPVHSIRLFCYFKSEAMTFFFSTSSSNIKILSKDGGQKESSRHYNSHNLEQLSVIFSKYMFQVTTFKEQHQAIFNLHRMSSSFSILIVSHAFQTILFYNAIDIADPSSIQDACAMSFVIDLAHRRVSVAQW